MSTIPTVAASQWDQNTLQDFKDFLVSLVPNEVVKDITIVGSYAQGYPDEDSDIDVLIWVDRPVKEFIKGSGIFRELPYEKDHTKDQSIHFGGKVLDVWLRSYADFSDKLLCRGYQISCYSIVTNTLYVGKDDNAFMFWKNDPDRRRKKTSPL